LHDFSPGILPSGLFWIVKVPDSAVQISPDGSSLHIHLEQVPEIDAFTFPPGTGNGITLFPTVPATASFDVTYTKTGNRRHIRPTSRDPLSPFNWAGEMSDATNSGTFSVTYAGGGFSASGSFSSSGNFGEMGTERNGSFVREDDFENQADDEARSAAALKSPSGGTAISQLSGNQSQANENAPQLKGRLLQWPAH
jgi:hypothetical protein